MEPYVKSVVLKKEQCANLEPHRRHFQVTETPDKPIVQVCQGVEELTFEDVGKMLDVGEAMDAADMGTHDWTAWIESSNVQWQVRRDCTKCHLMQFIIQSRTYTYNGKGNYLGEGELVVPNCTR